MLCPQCRPLCVLVMSLSPSPKLSESTSHYVSCFILTVSCSMFSLLSFAYPVVSSPVVSAVFTMCFHFPRYPSLYLSPVLPFVHCQIFRFLCFMFQESMYLKSRVHVHCVFMFNFNLSSLRFCLAFPWLAFSCLICIFLLDI